MGKERPNVNSSPAEIGSLLQNLHLSKGAHKIDKKPNASRHVNARRSELLESMVIDEQAPAEPAIDYAMLLQISDLLREVPVVSSTSSLEFTTKPRMKTYVTLLRNCGLSAELHYTYLKEWTTTTSRCLSSPVFSFDEYWSSSMLQKSVSDIALHCAILAVSALQYTRLCPRSSENRQGIQTAYRLRAEAERRSLHRSQEADQETSIGTVMCLLFFDYHTSNYAEWVSRISALKGLLQQLPDNISCNYYWTLLRHEKIALYMRDLVPYCLQKRFSMSSIPGLDRIGLLYAELLQICYDLPSRSLPAEQYDNFEARLLLWRRNFPISFQTYEYTGDVHDDSCFYPAQTCNGGPRAITLHCLYAETMIKLLVVAPVDFQRSKIHEHATTICKLVQPLTTSDIMLSDSTASDLLGIIGPLFVAGEHVFSKEGKRWVSETLRWIATVSGNLTPERLAGILEERWREIRTRPYTHQSEMIIDVNP